MYRSVLSVRHCLMFPPEEEETVSICDRVGDRMGLVINIANLFSPGAGGVEDNSGAVLMCIILSH